MFLNIFSRFTLALVINNRASSNLTINHKKQNNLFGTILLFNNMPLPYNHPLENLSHPQFENPGSRFGASFRGIS